MDAEPAESARKVGAGRGVNCRAMVTYPASMDKNERWKKIAEVIPGKTKSDCIKRVKWIREQMLKKSAVSNKHNTLNESFISLFILLLCR